MATPEQVEQRKLPSASGEWFVAADRRSTSCFGWRFTRFNPSLRILPEHEMKLLQVCVFVCLRACVLLHHLEFNSLLFIGMNVT